MKPFSFADNPAPTGGPQVPASIEPAKFAELMMPLFEELGLSSYNVVGENFSITCDAIEFLSIVPVAGVEPVAMTVSEDSVGCWTWPVRVEIPHACR